MFCVATYEENIEIPIIAGVEWLELSKEKLTQTEAAKFLSEGLKTFTRNLADAKKIHDHFLEKAGPVSSKHRCNRIPFDQKLRKKKKYKSAKSENGKSRPVKDKKLIPLYQEFYNSSESLERNIAYKEDKVRANFEDVCFGHKLRLIKIFCNFAF